MAIKDDTKRIVVTVEIELDEDGVEDLRDNYGGDMIGYLPLADSADVNIRRVIRFKEFGE